jgi:hypothetical protein
MRQTRMHPVRWESLPGFKRQTRSTSIWVNLSRILQMTLIDTQDGYPKTQIVMDNGAVICVFETPDDIAQWTKSANPPSK